MGTAEQGRPDVWLDSVGSVRIETGGQAWSTGPSPQSSQSSRPLVCRPNRAAAS